MHGRFAGATGGTATAPGGSFDLVVADSLKLRFLGLMRVDEEDVPALLFPNCRSLHMYWMKTPIDVVWLDLDLDSGVASVLAVRERLAPRARANAPKASEGADKRRIAALELRPGQATTLGIKAGGRIDLRIEPASSG